MDVDITHGQTAGGAMTESAALRPAAPQPATAARRGFWLAVGFLMLFAAAKPILFDTLDPDCFWHLRVGERLCAMPRVGPIVDDLSFASLRAPWTPYSWLAEMGMWKVWQATGFRGAIATAAVMQATLALLLAMTALYATNLPRRLSDCVGGGALGGEANQPRYMPALLGAAAALFIAMPFLSFRPVTAAFVLLALCGMILMRDRQRGERTFAIWLIPPIAALTVNIHLFAALIPMQIAAMLAGALWERFWGDVPRDFGNRRITRLLMLATLSGLACLATPMLPGMIDTVIHYSRHDPMIGSPVISETQPIWHGTMGLITTIVIAAFLLSIAARQKRLRVGEILWLAIGTVLLLKMARMAPIFALAAVGPIAATRGKLSDRPLTKPVIAWALACLLAIGLGRIAYAFPSQNEPLDVWLDRHGPDAPAYPCAAANWVQHNIAPSSGRLINEFNWGGYLEWRLGRHYRTLMDGRTQLFAPSFWSHTYLCGEPRRRDSLNQWQADAAILPAKQSEFSSDLLELGWTVAYRDPYAIVMTPPSQAALHPQPSPAAAMTDP